MHITVCGLSHKTAPIETREKISLDRDLDEVILSLLDRRSINEAVVVSTCNRTEVYSVVQDIELGKKEVIDCLCKKSGLNEKALSLHLYFYEGKRAIRHLFEVAASLDSMVVGEAQILGQLKKSYSSAQELQATDIIFNRLFRRAFRVGKRVRSETSIGENAVSISYAAVQLAKKVFEDLSGRTVMIVGAGKMSELTAKHLQDQGVKSVLVSNRTFEKAQELAKIFKGRAVRFKEITHEMVRADIVISSTGAPHAVIRKEDVAEVMKNRRNRPIFIIDIAVPRDVEAEVNSLYNVYLYDIDDLQSVVQNNLAERQKAARYAEEIIADEMKQFIGWLSSLEVAPTIVELKSLTDKIKAEELDKVLSHLQDINEHDKEHVRALATVVLNRILHEPIIRMKELSKHKDGYAYIDSLRYLFGLDSKKGRQQEDIKATVEKPEEATDRATGSG